MKSFFTSVLVVSAVLIGLILASQARANNIVVISDNYSWVANGTNITGSSPTGTGNVNLPGGTYTHNTFATADYFTGSTATGNPAPGIVTNSYAAAAILPLSSGTYTEPTTLTVSADLRVGNVGGTNTNPLTSDPPRGIGLGFFSAATPLMPYGGFTGFFLDSSGALWMGYAPDLSGGTFTEPGDVLVSWASMQGSTTFSTSSFYTLAFTVNRTTGTVANVTFNGVDYSSNFSTFTGFTTAATPYVGLGSRRTAPASTRLTPTTCWSRLFPSRARWRCWLPASSACSATPGGSGSRI